MPIIEDDVKKAMGIWLESHNYEQVEVRLGTRQGYDVKGINKKTNQCLVIECKGEAMTGSQHARSWSNVASAILTSLNEAEDPQNAHVVGMAFPDTKEYHGRMKLLKEFCAKQNFLVFWVSKDGDVKQW